MIATPGKLEQLLRMQQSVLLDASDRDMIAARVCQGATLITGALAARLVSILASGELDVLASYGDAACWKASADPARRSHTDRVPLLTRGTDDGIRLITVPLDASAAPVVLQLVAGPGGSFTVGHLALARCVASLASLGLRRQASPFGNSAAALNSELLLALSHDLRQPLNVLLGYTRLLLEETFGAFRAEQRGVLLTIERHALELSALVSGALDLARIDREAGSLRYETVALDALLTELCTGSLAEEVRSGVRLHWQTDPALGAIRTDRFRVRQILHNLIANALRYTERGEVSVTASPLPNTVRLVVSDTGPGIQPTALPALFEPFRPGGAASAQPGGTGCGLYLVKRFSEILGGRVTVDTALGMGTRFTVDLPSDGTEPREAR